MRTKTLASLLILCGSTAAFAHVTAAPQGGIAALTNTIDNSVSNEAWDNSVVPNGSDMLDNAADTPPG